jgi:hypothetical protein
VVRGSKSKWLITVLTLMLFFNLGWFAAALLTA